MNQNYIAGALSITAGFLLINLSYSFYRLKKNKISLALRISAGIFMIFLGMLGIYKNNFDGINILSFGITMLFYMRKDHNLHSGILLTMHNKGWIAAILAIIAGIIRILENFNLI